MAAEGGARVASAFDDGLVALEEAVKCFRDVSRYDNESDELKQTSVSILSSLRRILKDAQTAKSDDIERITQSAKRRRLNRGSAAEKKSLSRCLRCNEVFVGEGSQWRMLHTLSVGDCESADIKSEGDVHPRFRGCWMHKDMIMKPPAPKHDLPDSAYKD